MHFYRSIFAFAVIAGTICSVVGQTRSNDSRKIVIEIRTEKDTFSHKFDLGINPHTKPKETDYLSEDRYLESTASVDCIDCPFLSDMTVYATAYRKGNDKATVFIQVSFPNDRNCNIDEKRTVSEGVTLKLKQKCGVEVLVKFKDSKSESKADFNGK